MSNLVKLRKSSPNWLSENWGPFLISFANIFFGVRSMGDVLKIQFHPFTFILAFMHNGRAKKALTEPIPSKLHVFILLFTVTLIPACATEEKSWQLALEKNQHSEYELFLKKYKRSKFADEAHERIAWLKTLENNNIESFESFLRQYRSSEFKKKQKGFLSNFITDKWLAKTLSQSIKIS